MVIRFSRSISPVRNHGPYYVVNRCRTYDSRLYVLIVNDKLRTASPSGVRPTIRSLIEFYLRSVLIYDDLVILSNARQRLIILD